MNNSVLIVGSSRKDGNTTKIAKEIALKEGMDIVNLSDYDFSYYDYEYKNRNDDFLELVKNLINKYDTFIFATPVYWYNMSGIMKVFFDRISDLIRVEKETGRKLRGKKMGVISNSHEENLDYDFYLPFRKSAEYLGMEYIGNTHYNADTFNKLNNVEFTSYIQYSKC